MDSLLANLRTQLEDAHGKAQLITERAATDNRDLNDDEQRNFDGYKDTIERLQPRIEHLVETQRSFDASSAALAAVKHDGQHELLQREAPDFMARTYRSAGQWVVDYLTAYAPGSVVQGDARMAARDRITRAVANQTTADNPGLIPDTIAGPVINYQDTRRAVWNSLAQRAITAGPVFSRPRVTQHTLVGPQVGGEKTELASRKMLIERMPVNISTYGGVVDVSLQDQYWSNPDIMQVIIDDLRAQYVLQTENVAAQILNTTASVNVVGPVDLADPDAVTNAIYTAAANVLTGLGVLPSHLAMSGDVWAKLGALSDSTGRPLLPTLGPQNAPGQQGANSLVGTAWGLTTVVSAMLPANTLIVYRADAIEAWEQVVGVLQVQEPRLLGTEVAYAGFAAVIALHAEAAQSIDTTP